MYSKDWEQRGEDAWVWNIGDYGSPSRNVITTKQMVLKRTKWAYRRHREILEMLTWKDLSKQERVALTKELPQIILEILFLVEWGTKLFPPPAAKKMIVIKLSKEQSTKRKHRIEDDEPLSEVLMRIQIEQEAAMV